jgi:hypothetical protein
MGVVMKALLVLILFFGLSGCTTIYLEEPPSYTTSPSLSDSVICVGARIPQSYVYGPQPLLPPIPPITGAANPWPAPKWPMKEAIPAQPVAAVAMESGLQINTGITASYDSTSHVFPGARVGRSNSTTRVRRK